MNDQRKGGISWCDFTWPIINGCRRVSPGCEHCYAERLAATRLAHTAKYAGLAVMKPSGPRWTGKTRLWLPALEEPLKLKTPSRIFVADMGDLFFEEVSEEDIDAVFSIMVRANWHIYQVLTKRAVRMRRYSEACARGADATGKRWPLPNVWMGVSCEDRKHGLPRIDELRDTPAALRFLSLEPLLEDLGELDLTGIDWVIAGAESGPRARPMREDWVRSIRDQCVSAGVPFHYKQNAVSGIAIKAPKLDGRTWLEFPASPAEARA